MIHNEVALAQRERVRQELVAYSRQIRLDELITEHGTPLLLLDAARMRAQYRKLQQLLPGVAFYFALKAIEHPSAIEAVGACNGYIDVATPAEIAMVKAAGFPADRCMHTHPVKKPTEIESAYAVGLRRFVVDNVGEVQKFAGQPEDIELMVRLSYNDPDAGINLAYKFGAKPEDAREIVAQAVRQGTVVAGICMHVGSQVHDITAYASAVEATVQLIDELEAEHGITLRMLDIGGGFPVSYREDAPEVEALAAVIRPVIEPLQTRFMLMAEPGRFVVASAGTAVISVVGVTERHGEAWGYVDDGLYGLFANSLFESIYPHFFHMQELRDNNISESRPTTLAGPTCDSVDVLTTYYPLPPLVNGDVLISPMMGAYFPVCITPFNAIPPAKVVVIDSDEMGR